MSHRELKDPLYMQFARIGHAVASPVRVEILDLLSQGEKTVETLAEETATNVKNVSAHLRVLRHARLVETRRDGRWVHYRLADDGVLGFVRELQQLSRTRLAEVEQVTRQFIDDKDTLDAVTLPELRRMVRDGDVTILDVRPRAEYESGHIPDALSIPVSELKRRLRELPRKREIVAYCRGPYCVFSLEAVTLLRKLGYRARRADDGLPGWRHAGHPVASGAPS
jgi:rhodanese-related sulfurtransferase/DNA-binding transcriptional ArsR family regulator